MKRHQYLVPLLALFFAFNGCVMDVETFYDEQTGHVKQAQFAPQTRVAEHNGIALSYSAGVPIYPLIVDIPDEGMHILEIYVFAREETKTGYATKMSLHRGSFQRFGSSVGEAGETIVWTIGSAHVTFLLEAVNPSQWRLKVFGARSGECMVYARWVKASFADPH